MPNLKSKSSFNFVNYLFVGIVFLLFIVLILFFAEQLIPLWTMQVKTTSCDISTYGKEHSSLAKKQNPLRVEIITDFDKLSESKLALRRMLMLTLKEKPYVVVFLGKVGEDGKSQKKFVHMFYFLKQFKTVPEKIFVVPKRDLYEELLENTEKLIYYIDFFHRYNATVEFEGIEPIRDSLSFIMSSSVERVEYLKGILPGKVLILADDPREKVEEVFPEIFIATKEPKGIKKPIPPYFLVLKKGITFLNLY